MAELRYPNESELYRDAGDALLKERWESRNRSRARTPCCCTHLCSARTRTIPVTPARRCSMASTAPDIRLRTSARRSSQLPRRQPIASTPGPRSAVGHRSRWYPDRGPGQKL